MKDKSVWLEGSKKTVTRTKMWLGNLAKVVREDQFEKFVEYSDLKLTDKVLDVGVSDSETIKGTNLFEKLFTNHKMLTIASIEDVEKIKKKYPLARLVKIYPEKSLPFKDNEFDTVVSWATVEHVGGIEKQAAFLNELLRVGKKLFVTTPYRACVYEPHTELFFIHWMPLNFFRGVCNLLGKSFWSKEDNLNPLFVSDIIRMKLRRKVNIKIYKMFGLLPSHLIITSK